MRIRIRNTAVHEILPLKIEQLYDATLFIMPSGVLMMPCALLLL